MPFPRLPDLFLSLVLTSIIMLFIFWKTMVSRQQAVAGLKSQKPDTRTYSGQLSPTFSRFSAKTYPNSNSNWEISMQTETCRDILDSVCWAYREPLKSFDSTPEPVPWSSLTPPSMSQCQQPCYHLLDFSL